MPQIYLLEKVHTLHVTSLQIIESNTVLHGVHMPVAINAKPDGDKSADVLFREQSLRQDVSTNKSFPQIAHSNLIV